MHDVIPLDRLDSGDSAEVIDVLGRPEQVQRIRELGFHPGTQVQMVRAGSPCIVRLAGQTLCFRANELLRVLVCRADATAPRLVGVSA